MKSALKLFNKDNVATALAEIKGDEVVTILSSSGRVVEETKARSMIPFAHKLALLDLGEGEEIVKFGEVIGVASRTIEKGEWVHKHNVGSVRLPSEGSEEGIL
jgi:hypothetical protein